MRQGQIIVALIFAGLTSSCDDLVQEPDGRYLLPGEKLEEISTLKPPEALHEALELPVVILRTNPDEWAALMERAKESMTPEIAEIPLAAIESQEEAQRFLAVRVLIDLELESEAAIDAIESALNDENKFVQAIAAYATGKIGPKANRLQGALSQLKDKEYSGYYATWALARIQGDPKPEPADPFMWNENSMVYWIVIALLLQVGLFGHLKGKNGLSGFLLLVSSWRWVRPFQFASLLPSSVLTYTVCFWDGPSFSLVSFFGVR